MYDADTQWSHLAAVIHGGSDGIRLPGTGDLMWAKEAFSGSYYTPAQRRQRRWRWGILHSPCLFFHLSICRWHGFWNITQVCFRLSVVNFMCMLVVAIGKSLLIFSDVTEKSVKSLVGAVSVFCGLCINITCVSWHHKSSTTQMFAQQPVQLKIKKILKLGITGSLWGNAPNAGVFFALRGQ